MNREARDYWRQQRRYNRRTNRRMPGGYADFSMTKLIIGLMVLATLLNAVVPAWYVTILALPFGPLLELLISTIMPGSILSLIFSAIFVWMLGTPLEGFYKPWQFLLIFFVSGIVGGLATALVGGFGAGGAYAVFGLAGAYALAMSRFSGSQQSIQWVVILLILNVGLSGFQPIALAGMIGCFAAGLALAYLFEQIR